VHGTLCSARRKSCNRKKGYSGKVRARDRDADGLAKLGQVINTEQSLVGQARAEEIEKRAMISWGEGRTALRVEDNTDKLEGPDRLVPIYPYLAACDPGRVPSSALHSLCSAMITHTFDSDDTRTALYILAETRLLSNMSTLQQSPFPSRHPSADLGLANDNEDSNEDLAFAPAAPSTCKCTS